MNAHEPLETDTTHAQKWHGMDWHGVAWICSPTDGNLSYLCLGATFLLAPETFKFKKF